MSEVSPKRDPLVKRLGYLCTRLLIAVAVLAVFAPARSQAPAGETPADEEILPEGLQGPFVTDPKVVELLDHLDSGGNCAASGALVFPCLIQALAEKNARQAPTGALSNPFNLSVASQITETIRADLAQLKKDITGDGKRTALNAAFLTHPASRVELVGIVNRIDRHFIKDPVAGAEDHNRCGEISVIYRFYYSLRSGDVRSRLPVTMNVVFPAVPRAKPKGASNCREIAARWMAEMARSPTRSASQVVADLTDPATGVLSTLHGQDIERIELNMQAYRIVGSNDRTDFGSTAEYVIRVFRWKPKPKPARFEASYLTNQIDRARLLGDETGDFNSCDHGVTRKISKAEFVAYLMDPVVLSDIDTGTLNIREEFLACRATTVSPGGAHRSRNQPFWNAPEPSQQIIFDPEIAAAMKRAAGPARRFSFMKSPDDVRTRLNELSCSGCHQARAIAGFHFPGADRKKTPNSNAVLLPGSPHFFGDQARRRLILKRLAQGEKLVRYDLAASYASRPLNKFKPELEEKTELIGGWGGACLMPQPITQSQRQWTCKPNLECTLLFRSISAPGVGTCTPKGRPQIGDAMQRGEVVTQTYGVDRYRRTYPLPQTPRNALRDRRLTLIPDAHLPVGAPAENSYFAAHQEYYPGNNSDTTPPPLLYVNKRNAKTGGFPAGMLRLSECKGLPSEATCGLLAASGFSNCLDEVRKGDKKLDECFVERTSYAGVRACDAGSPCRDDYICLRPLGYTAATGRDAFLDRRRKVAQIQKPDDFGQQEPDADWLGRNGGQGDKRGLCIPPYFVFQFRSDGHPSPMAGP